MVNQTQMDNLLASTLTSSSSDSDSASFDDSDDDESAVLLDDRLSCATSIEKKTKTTRKRYAISYKQKAIDRYDEYLASGHVKPLVHTSTVLGISP